MAKQTILGIRVNDEQRGQFERAAKAAGKKISEWLRDVAIAVVAPPKAAELPEPGTIWLNETTGRFEKVPIQMSPQPQSGVSIVQLEQGEESTQYPIGVSPKALEYAAAAEAPIGRSITEFLLLKGSHVEVDLAEGPDRTVTVTRRSWLPELQKLAGRDDAMDLFNDLLNGRTLRRPPKWDGMNLEQRAIYLDEHCPLDAKEEW